MTRHTHADLIIQAANDTTIEWQRMSYDNWANIGKSGQFTFYPESQYRQRPTEHPHQAMIDQARADPSIEWQHSSQGSDWSDCLHLSGPQWHIGFNYRQKPAEVVMVDMWKWAGRGNDGMVWDNGFFYATEEEAQSVVSTRILCRIEGSKITVPEVSQ
jgi:hypothetical protein